jgi:hypothetical protein
MGLFSFGKSTPKTTNKVWMTREACLKGMVTEYLKTVKVPEELSFIVSFFEESHNRLVDYLSEIGTPHHITTSMTQNAAGTDASNIAIIKAYNVGGIPSGARSDAKVNFYLLGRYPYRTSEISMIDRLSAGFRDPEITYCLSLEDPLFEAMGSDKLKPLMVSLGMKDDESIDHPMVNKAIDNALEKINRDIVVEFKAHSEKEWFAKNIKK